jgi:hypothetical protein
MAAPPLNPSAIEKGETNSPNTTLSESDDSPHTSTNVLIRWNAKIESLAGLEARGIVRVPPDERYAPSTFGLVQMALLWFSANLTANNLTLAMLGPLVYELSFVDSALCAVFGGLLGSCGAAYMGTWGPQSGNRTLVSFNHRVYGRSLKRSWFQGRLTRGRLSQDISWAITLRRSALY